MKRLAGALFVFLCLTNMAAGSEGVDKVYKKPADHKSWGRLLADYIGYDGYRNSYAMVVGISHYEAYGDLPTGNDPVRVKDFLLHVAGFDRVYLLTEKRATRDRIRELMVDEIPRIVDRNDRFLFYWSGHGVTRTVREGTKGYLPLASTPADKYSEMISMDNIQRWDELLRAEQTLYLLDSCFSGLAGTRTQTDIRRITIKQMARPSRHLITAGTAGQRTIATDRLGGSIFTTALLDGLRGAADTTSAFESDGLVSVNELEDYVKKRVQLECEKSGWKASITPQVRDLAVNEGEFFFLTSNYKVAHIASHGQKPTGKFDYGEPVPMSGGAQPQADQSAAKAVEALEVIENSYGMKFVYISPASFTMGSPESEPGRRENEAEHHVTLTRGIYMQTTEVTQGQWQAVTGSNPAGFNIYGANCPVERVSWYDVQVFIKKLNKIQSRHRYRLPTEAEWEYAARAGTRTRFYSGDTEDDLDRAAWFSGNSDSRTHPVGVKEPNAFGLYDMLGNVWEWVEDDWHEDYHQGAPNNGTAWIDEPRSQLRVIRGGGWFFNAVTCRSAFREKRGPGILRVHLGFRLVLLPK